MYCALLFVSCLFRSLGLFSLSPSVPTHKIRQTMVWLPLRAQRAMMAAGGVVQIEGVPPSVARGQDRVARLNKAFPVLLNFHLTTNGGHHELRCSDPDIDRVAASELYAELLQIWPDGLGEYNDNNASAQDFRHIFEEARRPGGHAPLLAIACLTESLQVVASLVETATDEVSVFLLSVHRFSLVHLSYRSLLSMSLFARSRGHLLTILL